MLLYKKLLLVTFGTTLVHSSKAHISKNVLKRTVYYMMIDCIGNPNVHYI